MLRPDDLSSIPAKTRWRERIDYPLTFTYPLWSEHTFVCTNTRTHPHPQDDKVKKTFLKTGNFGRWVFRLGVVKHTVFEDAPKLKI